MPNACPKCGSIQTSNDQCFQCGIIISKYVSTVAKNATNSDPQPSHLEHSYTINNDVILYEERRRKARKQTRLIGLILIAVITTGGYLIYDFFTHRASTYKGLYKNHKLIYGLKFPESGGDWYHAESGLLEELGLENPSDAFYKGDQDEPDITIAVFTEGHTPVPEQISGSKKAEILDEAEASILKRMDSAGVQCEFIDPVFMRLGGRDGLVIETDLEKEGIRYKAFIARAFYLGNAFTLYFVGPEEKMLEMDQELQRLIKSFSFKVSPI